MEASRRRLPGLAGTLAFLASIAIGLGAGLLLALGGDADERSKGTARAVVNRTPPAH